MAKYAYTLRLTPEEIFAPQFSRLTNDEALEQVHGLLGECFWPLDVRYEKVVRIIELLGAYKGVEARTQFVLLDKECRFFITLALQVYGLQLHFGDTSIRT